jgi:integrase/recombinase XerD
MLTIYRRHSSKCAHRSEGRKYRRCHCPIWVDGFVGGQEVRESLDLRNWEEAQDKVREWEAQRSKPKEPNEHRLTIEGVCAKYLEDAQSRQLGPAALYKYGHLTRQLKAFATDRGLRYMEEIDLDLLRDFRNTWPNRNVSAKKKLEQLRNFFRFCARGGRLAANPALELDAPIVKETQKIPFTQEEMAQLLHACDHLYADNYGRLGRDNAKQIRALALLLRYSGLRIGDAATLPASRVSNGRLFLRTAKTGTHVSLLLPPLVLDALGAAPRSHPLYFFWTGDCSHKTAVRHWQHKLARLFRLAKVIGGHPHRFRHTFAIAELVAGTPIDQVAMLLGHSSIKVTEKHYSAWVKARQDQVDASVIRSWEEDPLIVQQRQPLTKGTKKVHGDMLVQ